MPDETGDAGTPDAPAGDTPDDLGEAGQKALDAFKERARTAERDLKKLNAELVKLREQNQTEAEKALNLAREEGKAEALAALTGRLVGAEVRAAAVGKLQDPEDAAAFLDLTSFVDAAGEVDSKAIASAIDALVAKKPHLAVSATPQQQGTGGGGARQQPTPLNGDPILGSVKEKLGIR